jgi:hypothetical protein
MRQGLVGTPVAYHGGGGPGSSRAGGCSACEPCRVCDPRPNPQTPRRRTYLVSVVPWAFSRRKKNAMRQGLVGTPVAASAIGRGRFVARDFFRITVAAGRVPLAPEVVRLASLVPWAFSRRKKNAMRQGLVGTPVAASARSLRVGTRICSSTPCLSSSLRTCHCQQRPVMMKCIWFAESRIWSALSRGPSQDERKMRCGKVWSVLRWPRRRGV